MKSKLFLVITILSIVLILVLIVSCTVPAQSNKSVKNGDKDLETGEAKSEDATKEDGGNIEISWEEAKEYDGQTVTVTGPVVDYFYSEDWEFTSLSIGKTDKGGVLVVIYDKNREGFPEDMESYYMGKVVSATGEVSYRKNSDASQIDIDNPEQIKVISESNSIISDTEVSEEAELVFSYTEDFPEYWGNIRIVDPLLADFKDVEFAGDGNEVIITGKLVGNENLRYCLNPEMGVFTSILGLIFDSDNNIKWEQDGYLKGTGSYIKEGETKEFILANQTTVDIDTEVICIIIAHTEGGMIEDSVMDADKGIFGVYVATLTPE